MGRLSPSEVALLPFLGLLGLLLVKEAGLPIPVPGDLLVIGAGIAAAGSGATAPFQLGAILVAGFAGGSIQFLLVRGAFRRPLLALLARLGVPRERLDTLAAWLQRAGMRGVAVARATPGVRIGATAASGLAALAYPAFFAGLVIGNTVFVGAHFALGYVLGPPALDLLARVGGVGLALVALALFAVVGALGWRWLRARRAGARRTASADEAAGATSDIPSAGAWLDAACPACLAVSAVRLVRTTSDG